MSQYCAFHWKVDSRFCCQPVPFVIVTFKVEGWFKVCVCVCVHVHACMRACVCVYMCMRACVRVRGWVGACVWIFATNIFHIALEALVPVTCDRTSIIKLKYPYITYFWTIKSELFCGLGDWMLVGLVFFRFPDDHNSRFIVGQPVFIRVHTASTDIFRVDVCRLIVQESELSLASWGKNYQIGV